MAKKDKVSEVAVIPVTVRVPVEVLDGFRLEAGINGDVAAHVGAVCSMSLTELGSGGLIVHSDLAERLRKIVQIKTADDLVGVFERAARQEDGRRVFRWKLDESYVQHFQNLADRQGVSLDRFMQSCIEYIFDKGWLYDVEPSPHTVTFSREEYQSIVDAVGHDNVTGGDIVEFILGKQAMSELAGLSS